MCAKGRETSAVLTILTSREGSRARSFSRRSNPQLRGTRGDQPWQMTPCFAAPNFATGSQKTQKAAKPCPTPHSWAELSVCPIRASPPHVTSFTPNLRPKVSQCRVGAGPFPLHTNTPPTQMAGNKLHSARSQCKIFGTPRPRAYGCFYQYARTGERTALYDNKNNSSPRAPRDLSRYSTRETVYTRK